MMALCQLPSLNKTVSSSLQAKGCSPEQAGGWGIEALLEVGGCAWILRGGLMQALELRG